MATDKTFSVAGISKHNGEYKVRFANDFSSRVKALLKNGHEDIRLAQLDSPKTKVAAVKELLTSEGFEDVIAQEVLHWYVNEHSTKGPAATHVHEPVEELEDQPF